MKSMINKKSQAALEFLTTYGWAFLVVGVTISALYYFGALDFSKYLPQNCVFPSQFKCADFSLTPGQVRIKLTNNIGEDVCVKAVSITNDANPPVSCSFGAQAQGICAASEFGWDHSADKEFVFSSCSGGAYIAGERAELKVTMVYYALNTPSKPQHTFNGKINGRITTS